MKDKVATPHLDRPGLDFELARSPMAIELVRILALKLVVDLEREHLNKVRQK